MDRIGSIKVRRGIFGCVLGFVVLLAIVGLSSARHTIFHNLDYLSHTSRHQISPSKALGITPVSGNQPLTSVEVSARMGIPFIPNEGQVNERVGFYAKTLGGTVFVTKTGEIVYSLTRVEGKMQNVETQLRNPQLIRGVALKEELVGGRAKGVKGEGVAVTKVNYFGASRSKSNVPTYSVVSLGEVYKGVEIRLRAYGNNVEKLF